MKLFSVALSSPPYKTVSCKYEKKGLVIIKCNIAS